MKENFTYKLIPVDTNNADVIIYLRVTVNRRKCEISLGLRGLKNEWLPNQGRFIETKNYNRYLNNQIEIAIARLQNCVSELFALGIKPTASQIVKEFKGEKNSSPKPILIHHINNFITRREQLVGTQYSRPTITHYKVMLRRLTEFLNREGLNSILVRDFKRIHIIKFKEFLLTHIPDDSKWPLKLVTVNKYLARLKAVLNDAVALEIISTNPFNGIRLERITGNREFLTKYELRLIEQLDLSHNRSLDWVRSIFLFSAYTGLRYSDTIGLLKSNILPVGEGRYRVRIVQKKTKSEIERPLLPQAVNIFQRFNEVYPESLSVFPKLSNQKLNTYLKLIGEMAGIKKNLTHHVARHTFATLMLEAGIDLKMVAHFLGHRSVRTTEEVYAKVTHSLENTIIDKFNSTL